MLLSEQAYQKIDRELTKFPSDQQQSAIMAALTIAQEEKGWVSTEVIADVAAYLNVPAIAVQEVATFYNMFNTHQVGRFKKIGRASCRERVCHTCRFRGARDH